MPAAEMSPPVPCLGGSREPRNPRPLPGVRPLQCIPRQGKRRTRRRRPELLARASGTQQFRARAARGGVGEIRLWFGCLPAIAWSPCPQL